MTIHWGSINFTIDTRSKNSHDSVVHKFVHLKKFIAENMTIDYKPYIFGFPSFGFPKTTTNY